jgi:threonylcarbamoyladenosine tRNA methylthiotransferase MtaB
VVQTFSISILGCRVNHYEAEQIAQVLRSRGLRQVEQGGDVRVVHTCSVTSQAAKGSRQQVRRATRLNVLQPAMVGGPTLEDHFDDRAKVIVTGCWATSDRSAAEKLPGVDAVITHHEDVNERLTELINEWSVGTTPASPASRLIGKPGDVDVAPTRIGSTSLPLLHDRQSAHQRAFLKIQDGCDAHCTYCIIPQLRPQLWSKSPDDAVAEAQALVDAGHKELVLTGIFLGAYGQPTALRRRQEESTSKPIARLIDALCTRVRGLSRLRLSSLEPGDLDSHLIDAIKHHPQLVPHFHLPLQAGSDRVLRKMNRQYTRDQFIEMVALVNESFDRPALTTDIICGFPGETDADFDDTLDIVDRARFIHTHAFTYSPRPKTAAARWTKEFVDHRVANERIKVLNDRAQQHSFAFRQTFVGETVTVLVERENPPHAARGTQHELRHGRSERYFDVHFDALPDIRTGDQVRVRIDSVTPTRTHGTVVA